MQDVVLAAFLVVEDELDGDARAVRPAGVRRARAVAAKIARVGSGSHRLAATIHFWQRPAAVRAARRPHGKAHDARPRHRPRLPGRRHARRAVSPRRRRRRERAEVVRPRRRRPRADARCSKARPSFAAAIASSSRWARILRRVRPCSPTRPSSTTFRSTSASPRSTSTTTCRCSSAPGRTRPTAAAEAERPRAGMDTYLLDWANFALRWAHVVTGIAWIGASFYFVGLDASLTPPADESDRAKGIGGELWAVHGGGFYHQQKYPVAPSRLPEQLHWSMWESYSTWLTGFALFAVLYLFNASTFLIDKSVFDWSPAAAIATALAFFVAFWLIYDAHLPRLRPRPARRPDRRRPRLRLHRLRLVAVVPPVRRPRRVPARRRDDGDDDERQRADGHHSRPEQGRRRAARRHAGRSGARPARQAAQRPQHLLHAAGHLHDDQQPLRLRLRRAPQLAGAGGADARRRADPDLVRAAPQGAGRAAAGAVALRHRRHAGRWSRRSRC